MRYRSRLEGEIAVALSQQGHPVNYEADRVPYIVHSEYIPDFYLDGKAGRVYIEAKGMFDSQDRAKILAVLFNNPEIRLFVALQRPSQRISKKSRTTYAQWCEKHCVPWCPVPIPETYLQKWLDGLRPTFRAQARNAPRQMELL